jgi:transcription antitermination protein NusB
MSCAESNDSADEGGPRPLAAGRSASRSARRRARELALQGLYGWLLSGGECAAIVGQLDSLPGYAQADQAYLLELIRGTIGSAEALRSSFSEAIDRPLAELSPIEHSILLIATYELAHRPEIPFRVIINEAVELAKGFGATDGFRYVNGVLDRLAGRIRSQEAGAGRVAR